MKSPKVKSEKADSVGDVTTAVIDSPSDHTTDSEENVYYTNLFGEQTKQVEKEAPKASQREGKRKESKGSKNGRDAGIDRLPLSLINQHPRVDPLLYLQGIVAPWTLPIGWLTPQAVCEMIERKPLHVIEKGGEYFCFDGVRLLDCARKVIPPGKHGDVFLAVILHAKPSDADDSTITNNLRLEFVVEPIYNRHSPAELDRLIEVITAQSSDPLATQLFNPQKKADLAKTVKKSLSSLRPKKK